MTGRGFAAVPGRGASSRRGTRRRRLASSGSGPSAGRITGRRTFIIAGAGALAGVAAALGYALGYALWWRKNPSACPYGLRFFVELPHPFITRARRREALAPRPGERVLEVGPGTGYYALHVAEWLGPSGRLDGAPARQTRRALREVPRPARRPGKFVKECTRRESRPKP